MARDEPSWCLERLAGSPEESWRIPVSRGFFRIGRRPGLDLTLPSESVSREHAEISCDGKRVSIRDLGSANGTFVNGRRLDEEVELRPGDRIQFGSVELRLCCSRAVGEGPGTLPLEAGETARLARQARAMRELFERGAVRTLLQPVVRLPGRELVGYELLGRGAHPELPEAPGELFAAASEVGAETRLSRLLRAAGLDTWKRLPAGILLFCNSHPAELREPELVASLEEAGALTSHLHLMLEIHEASITDVGQMRELRRELSRLGVGLAYDDFGAGQARLLELAEAPPDYLKFDASLIHGIHGAPASRRHLLESLVRMVLGLGIAPVAEGVEEECDHEVCCELGFTHAQGFLYGRPGPPAEGPDSDNLRRTVGGPRP